MSFSADGSENRQTPTDHKLSSGISPSRIRIFQHALGSDSAKLISHLENARTADVTAALHDFEAVDSVSAATLSRLSIANVIAEAARDNVSLATAILEDGRIVSTRDIALNYGFERVKSLASQTGADERGTSFRASSDHPSVAKGQSDGHIQALRFRRRLFELEPTAVLQQMISSNDEAENPSEALSLHHDRQICSQVAKFLDSRPDFNIRSQPVLAEVVADENAGGFMATLDPGTSHQVTESLKLLQRTQALTPTPETIKPLLDSGMTSALRISSMPRNKFTSRMSSQFTHSVGLEKEDALALAHNIHKHATLSRARADSALVQLHQALKGSSLVAIDGATTLADRRKRFGELAKGDSSSGGFVDLDDLFQDMDMCECSACEDINSPTAYYVDLLQYLRNNDLDDEDEWDNTGKEGYQNTVLEKLFIRRPDLQHLELTCRNANTVLPYIDLANEIMESFVIHLNTYSQNWVPSKPVALEAWSIDSDKESNELLAVPAHTRKPAYCILKEAVYPIASLPYFQPLDAIRLYLQYLGVSRYELIDTLRLTSRQWKVRSTLLTEEKKQLYTNLRHQLQDRAATAEYLDLSPDEYVIITRESIWPIECSLLSDSGALLTLEDYQHQIGVRLPEEYWGYKGAPQDMLSNDSSTRVGLAWVKAQFLRRSGLSYQETVDLVKTYYVNPMLPSGRDRIVMDAIRFSYRFLQRLAALFSSVISKVDTITHFLYLSQPWVHLVELAQEIPKGNALLESSGSPTFTRKEIRRWVSRWFDCVGKLVVLDSGQGPRLPTRGYLIYVPQNKEASFTLKDLSSVVESTPNTSSTSVPPISSTSPTVLGYLESDGGISDAAGKLVGAVAITGQVLYPDWNPIRAYLTRGQLVILGIPKVTGDPLGTVNEGIVRELLTASIGEDSYLETYRWNAELPRTRVRWVVPKESCSIESTRLLHLNGSGLELWEWDRINRFIRLYRKLQSDMWTIHELDMALKGLWKTSQDPHDAEQPSTPRSDDLEVFSFSRYKGKSCDCDCEDEAGECSCSDDDGGGNDGSIKSPCHPSNFVNISARFLGELRSVKQLGIYTSMREALLALWTDMDTMSADSLFQKTFVTRDLQRIDPVFKPDENGNFLVSEPIIGDHVPVLVAALQIKANLFDAALEHAQLSRTDVLSISALTKLYRIKILSKVIGMSFAVTLDALDIFTNPFTNASRTLDVYETWNRISTAGLSIKQLRYVCLGINDLLQPLGPSQVTVLKTTKAILDGLGAIQAAHPDPTPEQEAGLSINEVKAKATLVFSPATVETITGIIEGTGLYTTNAPAGLVIDRARFSDKIVYRDAEADVSGPKRAKLTVKGALADEELEKAIQVVPGNELWNSALARLRKQVTNRIKINLGMVFGDKIEEAVQVLSQGDVAAVAPTSDTDLGSPGTAPAKRAFLMRALIPFVRKYLETQLINTTISTIASLSPDMASLLLDTIIRVGASGAEMSAMNVLKRLSAQAESPSTGSWSGFLITTSTDHYIFYTYAPTQPTSFFVNGKQIVFPHQGEDPDDEWWTEPLALTGGKLYTISGLSSMIPGQLLWKTTRTDVVPIPRSALIPGSSAADVQSIFQQIYKVSLLVQTFNLEESEVKYLQEYGADFDSLDLNKMTFAALLRLLSYAELRDSLPKREKTLIDLFQWASQSETPPGSVRSGDIVDLPILISSVTAWDQQLVTRLIDSKIFDLRKQDFINESALKSIGASIQFIKKIGPVDLSQLISWADLKLDFDNAWSIAKSILYTIRGKYTQEDFEQAIKPSHDQLRKDQRDALIAFLLVQPCLQQWGIQDADGLFEFFLIDVQMGSCMQTSRIKQAISSVQQFVQRVMLGLEEHDDPKIHVPNDALDPDRWDWMAKQTMWTAHRKTFLYPENWLFPSLRDNKTPIYGTMEGELLQKELNPANILESFKGYITDLDQVSHLRAVGMHVQEDGANHILHFIGMTPSSPFAFHYRIFDSRSQEWTPWSQIQVDIPIYTQDYLYSRKVGEGSSNTPEVLSGCYAIPFLWGPRTVLFIGQISPKTVPNTSALNTKFGDMTKPDSNKTANNVSPKQCWEIKVSYTEYRSGRWTPKAISADILLTGALDTLSPADAFQFFPKKITPSEGAEYISIEVWQCWQDPMDPMATTKFGIFVGEFIFNGSLIVKGDLLYQKMPENWIATNFHWVNGRSPYPLTTSFQKNGDDTLPYFNRDPSIRCSAEFPYGLVSYDATTKDMFYHPFTNLLLQSASKSTTEIDPILAVFISTNFSDPTIAQAGFGAGAVDNGHTNFAELSRPYSNYNWELGFHGPMHVAQALLTSQQYDGAFEMIHHVFNPYANGPDEKRVWKWPPFKEAAASRVLESILGQLRPRQFDKRITQWRDHPFQPYVVARGRTVAYMKWTVMTYIKALVAYGDYYFRRRTLEDLPRALQLYVVASHMYGAKGQAIPRQGKKVPQTYFSLLDKWDAFSNAAVQLELQFPFSNQTPFPWGVSDDGERKVVAVSDTKEVALANIFGLASSSYFCLPTNPDLQALRTTIDTRLFNIRNCLDIDGKPMPLALWEPPIDPGQLVTAVASGLSLSSALNDLNASLPNYRFTWLMSKAVEVVSELKGLENTFLSIKEKRDGEALSRLRSQHDITMANKALEMKKVQLEEAVATVRTLEASQESPRFRHSFFANLTGVEVPPLGGGEPFKRFDLAIEAPSTEGDMHMSSAEKEESDQAETAQVWNHIAAGHEVLAGILHAVPSFNLHTTPMGCGVEIQWGMPNIAAAAQATARSVQILSSHHSYKSSTAGRKAQNIRQYQDRIQQLNLAGFEFEHITSQIAVQKIRIQLANQDIDNQQKLIDNANEVDQFLRNKYTNDELYQYLESSTRQNMYQTYQLAYDLAKKAELAFRFERKSTNQQEFISFGYFNPGRDGLQSGQQLYLALKQMETAYQSDRGYDFELTKSVSLRQLNPYALLTLRETGACQIDLPEVLFDMDFPGHYFRRLKTVSLTIPCVTGPYTGINTTLRLLSHRYRWNPASDGSGKDYLERIEGNLDARFRTDHVPIDAIAASSAQSDSGVFELTIRDERYLPFEGAGTVSNWQLQLPSFAQFDYKTIADVVLTIRYTSCDGGLLLRKAAAESVAEHVATIEGYSQSQGLMTLFDLRSDFASEWAKLATAASNSSSAGNAGGDVTQTLFLRGLSSRLPAFTLGRSANSVRATDISVLTTLPLQPDQVAVAFRYMPPKPNDEDTAEYTAFDSGPVKIGKNLGMVRLTEADSVFGNWGLKVTLPLGTEIDATTRMWMVVRYKMMKNA